MSGNIQNNMGQLKYKLENYDTSPTSLHICLRLGREVHKNIYNTKHSVMIQRVKRSNTGRFSLHPTCSMSYRIIFAQNTGKKA